MIQLILFIASLYWTYLARQMHKTHIESNDYGAAVKAETRTALCGLLAVVMFFACCGRPNNVSIIPVEYSAEKALDTVYAVTSTHHSYSSKSYYDLATWSSPKYTGQEVLELNVFGWEISRTFKAVRIAQ